jgi:hypothetical protein
MHCRIAEAARRGDFQRHAVRRSIDPNRQVPFPVLYKGKVTGTRFPMQRPLQSGL